MKDINKTIGKNLREQREKKKITVDDISYKSRVSRSSVYRIEQGFVDPKVSTLKKLADALGIEVVKLMVGV